MTSHNEFGYPRSAAIVGADVPVVYRDSPQVQEFYGRPIEATRSIQGAGYDSTTLAETDRLIGLVTSRPFASLQKLLLITEIELDS
jgi:hypothetical protein